MCFPSIITTALHHILSALLCLAGVHHLRNLLCFVQPNQASELQNALATAALCILLWIRLPTAMSAGTRSGRGATVIGAYCLRHCGDNA